ncbi:hypothetical protein Tco_1292024 [Tanacetum coccineum]
MIMTNQIVQVMRYFEHTPIVAYLDNKITSDSNIIPYSQYLLETQQAVVQDTNSFAQQDSMILSVIEQMQHEVIPMTDGEETLILEELNKLSEDFGKRFVPQMQLSAEQALWLPFSNPKSEHPNDTQTSVRVEVPKELPKCSVDKKLFEIEKKELKLENDRLLEHIISQDVVNIVMHADVKSDNVLHVQNTFLDDNIAIDVLKMENDRLMKLLVSQDLVHTVVNSLAAINDYKSMKGSYIEEYERNLKLEVELSQMNELSKTYALEFHEFFIINELKAQLQAKDTTIRNLKKHIQELKGKSVADCRESVNKPKVIALVVYKLDLEPLSLKLKNNREAHVDFIRITKENADTLRDTVDQARTSNPLDNALAYACMYTKQIQELLVYVSDTCPSSPSKSEKLVAVTPMNKARKVTFAKTSPASHRKEKCTLQCALSSKEKKSSYLRAVLSRTSIRLGLHQLTPGYISSGLAQNLISPTPYVPPSKKDYEILFQPLFDEYFNPPPRVVSPDLVAVAAPRSVDLEMQSQVIHQGVEEQIHGHQNAQFDNAPLLHNLSLDPSSEETTLKGVIPSNLHHLNQSFDTLTKLTNNHPLENVIGNLSRPVLTRSQLQEHAIWCYFDADDNLIPFGG